MNLPTRWPKPEGTQIGQICGIAQFKFINDFEANGYGINRVQEKDLDFLNGATQIPDKCKCIIGPGTGLG